MNRVRAKIMALVLITLAIGGFFYADLHLIFNLDTLKIRYGEIAAYHETHPLSTIVYFFLAYVMITSLSLPGAAILTLAGGAIFGLLIGTVLASFASTIGATIAFLTSRFLFRAPLKKKFSSALHTVNQGIVRDGAFYLFALRLVPVFPFFIVNLVMGLTTIKLSTFFIVSQIGMLAGTVVYTYAGTRLGQVTTLRDIFSPSLLFAFALLGLFPLLTKKIVEWLRARRRQSDAQTENI